MFDQLSPDQLQETVPQEQATYVINLAPASTAQLSVEIPLNR
jgi:hypothetical protein